MTRDPALSAQKPRAWLACADDRAGELQTALEAAGLTATRIRESAELLTTLTEDRPLVALVDSDFADGDAVFRAARRIHPDTLCVLFANRLDEAALRRLEASGADTLLSTPLSGHAIERVLRLARDDQAAPSPALVPFISGESPEMARALRDAMAAAHSRAPLLITGETGVGKEVFARMVHRLSPRRGPFVAVNCAALPETLLEAEMFGYERGAFTGALHTKKGRFELAHGGTLFLDEIGDLPLQMQVKLLRVLQEHTFERLGGNESLHADVRIIAATHRDLRAACAAGTFRLDLFFRLHVLGLLVPAVRERGEDVLALWTHFIEETCTEEARPLPRTTPAAGALLRSYAWDGNVRELQSAARQALIAVDGDEIDVRHLPARVRSGERMGGAVPQLAGMTMREIERLAIEQTLTAQGDVASAARALGLSERTIFSRLRAYRLEDQTVQEANAAKRVSTHVLLAEDDDDLRDALSDLLREEGFEVTSVADGSAALETLAQLGASDAPQVLVTDVRMPRAGGLDVLAAIRERQLRVPVIVMSAFGDGGTRDRALALGAGAFLEKPVAIPDLQRAIAALVPASLPDAN